jgi:hypothetical protein
METKVLFITTLHCMSILISLTYLREFSLNDHVQTGSGAHPIDEGEHAFAIQSASQRRVEVQLCALLEANLYLRILTESSPLPRISIGLPVLLSDVMRCPSSFYDHPQNLPCAPISLTTPVDMASYFSVFLVYLTTLSLAQAVQRRMTG